MADNILIYIIAKNTLLFAFKASDLQWNNIVGDNVEQSRNPAPEPMCRRIIQWLH